MTTRDELHAIAKEVQALRSEDTSRYHAVRDRVIEAQTQLQLEKKNDLAGYLDAALTLIDGVFRLPDSVAGDVAWLAGSLLDVVSRAQGERVKAASDAATDPNEWLECMSDLMLGEILVRIGAMQRSDVPRALELQLASGGRFGEVAVAAGMVSPEDVDLAVELQGRLGEAPAGVDAGTPASAEPASAAGDAPIPGAAPPGPAEPETGSPAAEAPHAPPLEGVRPALQMTGSHAGFRGGAESSHRGLPSTADLPSFTDLLLGEVLLKREKIDAAQLEQALAVQRATGKRIGEALVEIGAIGWRELEIAVSQQRNSRERRPSGGQRRRSLEL